MAVLLIEPLVLCVRKQWPLKILDLKPFIEPCLPELCPIVFKTN